MAKKTQTQAVALVEAKSDDVVGFALTPDVEAFAVRVNVGNSIFQAPLDERADYAADHMNRSQKHMLAAGLLLLSIKADAEHGAFAQLIADRGFEERAAQRAMTYAEFMISRPAAERDALLEMPRYKVLTLAQADPEVVDQLMADGGTVVNALSIKAMADRIKELEAESADKDVQLETAQNQVKAAQKAAARALKDHASDIPLPVFDVRQEMVALIEKARLCLESMQSANTTLTALRELDDTREYVAPSARLGFSGLLALRVQIDGLLHAYVAAHDLEDIKPEPISYLRQEEVELVARKFPELTALHEHEAKLRDWHRKQDRPRGKGRPEAKPAAPATTLV